VQPQEEYFPLQILYGLTKITSLVETIRAVIVTKINSWGLSCNDFSTSVSNNPILLREIHSSQKHKTSAQEYEPIP
jgi:hypothetical protein